MCGIVGSVLPPGGSDCGNTGLSVSRLSHRGPDTAGERHFQLPWGLVSLGTARLKIVDQSDLCVPQLFVGPRVAVAFCGEIYNWRALRAELSDGQPWESDCDTEVVARAWRRWGAGMLERFNGMFGLAVVDLKVGVVFLARDRAGEKPLYWRAGGGELWFASEIKALPGELREVPCPELDCLEFDCLEATPFSGVRRLGPGECLLIRSLEDVADPRPRAWWVLPRGGEDSGVTRAAALDELEALVVDAIRLRCVAEVPVAVLLSGGLDSAIVQAVARCDALYCCSFEDDGLDNMRAARQAAAGAGEVIPVRFGLAELRAVLPRVAYHLDTPATWTAVCQWHLFERIAADGGRVVLSGEGADELFWGYSRYRLLSHLDSAALDPLLGAYRPTREKLLGSEADVLARLLNRGGPGALSTARKLVDRCAGEVRPGQLVSGMARTEWHTTMQLLLRMADRMAAAHSLENRAPFLDHRIIEFAVALPARLKIDPDWTKALLRDVAERLGVPVSITRERTKRGLAIPWARWTGTEGGNPWERGGFASEMLSAWRSAYRLDRTSLAACG